MPRDSETTARYGFAIRIVRVAVLVIGVVAIVGFMMFIATGGAGLL